MPFHPARTGRARVAWLSAAMLGVAVVAAQAGKKFDPLAGLFGSKPRSYSEARSSFQTRLRRFGPAPQDYPPTKVPEDAVEVPYRSGDLLLKAWVSKKPSGERAPAVLFLHGGFSFSNDDWEMAKPFRDEGFVVMMPVLRGENGLPGDFSMLFYEVDDVVAAAEAEAALPWVRADELYLAGHSVGGTLALLAAMRTTRFRAAVSFSAAPEQASFISGRRSIVPYNPDDREEIEIRSPLAYAASFQCPVRAYHGSAEGYFQASTAIMAAKARSAGLDVRAVTVPGDHFSHVPAAMKEGIEFFRSVTRH